MKNKLPEIAINSCEHFLCAWSPLLYFFLPKMKNIRFTLIGNFLSKVIGKSSPLIFLNLLKLKTLYDFIYLGFLFYLFN